MRGGPGSLRHGRVDTRDRQAVIDIGSNTVRLVVFDGPARAPVQLHNEKVSARLGRDLSETGRIPDKAADAALAALARYAVLLRELEVGSVECVATAAARDAENGPHFLDRVRALGFAPRLLSGAEEAETSADGVIAAFPGAQGMVADLGGGSLELVEIGEGRPAHGISLPLGTLRLGDLRKGGQAKFAAHVAKLLAKADYDAEPDRPLYLVGGSLRALGRYAMLRGQSPLDDAHGMSFAAAELGEACEAAIAAKPKQLSEYDAISSFRLSMLPDAAALMAVLLRTLRPSGVTVSAWGLREGLLYRRMPPAVRSQSPLLAGVAAFAEPLGGAWRNATMVAGWIAGIASPGDTASQELRQAAIMLALAARRVEPNLRRRHVLDWALHKRWIGIGISERAMLAAALVASTGTAKLPEPLEALAPADRLAQGTAWGLALRLCHRIADCSIRSLIDTRLTSADGVLVLQVGTEMRPLICEHTEKDLRQLAGFLGCDWRIDVQGAG